MELELLLVVPYVEELLELELGVTVELLEELLRASEFLLVVRCVRELTEL